MGNENKWEYDYSSQNRPEGGTGYPNVGSSGMNTANQYNDPQPEASAAEPETAGGAGGTTPPVQPVQPQPGAKPPRKKKKGTGRRIARSAVALVLAGVMLLLCGCGGMTTDDAMDYVQSALDCGYKAEVKKYAKITETTEKEAKKEYETNLDNSMKEAGFDETGVSDELKANYRKLFEKMLKSANYKVGEVKEAGDDEFKVSVEVQPFTAFSTVSEELDNWVTDTYSNIEYVPSDEELNEAIMKKMYELMDEKMNNPTYGDKTTVTVNVKVDKDGAYYIPQKDLTAVDDALFPEDAL